MRHIDLTIWPLKNPLNIHLKVTLLKRAHINIQSINNKKKGLLYFFEQYIKMGIFVGGAGLEQKDEEQGKQEVAKLNMATKGNCGSES